MKTQEVKYLAPIYLQNGDPMNNEADLLSSSSVEDQLHKLYSIQRS